MDKQCATSLLPLVSCYPARVTADQQSKICVHWQKQHTTYDKWCFATPKTIKTCPLSHCTPKPPKLYTFCTITIGCLVSKYALQYRVPIGAHASGVCVRVCVLCVCAVCVCCVCVRVCCVCVLCVCVRVRVLCVCCVCTHTHVCV